MSREKFEDGCPGCRPVLLDQATMEPFAKDHPAMVAVMRVWATTTLEERQAFHDLTCLNHRDRKTVDIVMGINRRFEAAIKEDEAK